MSIDPDRGRGAAIKPLRILLSLVAMVSAARADEARDVPALGAKLTYRFVSTTTTSSGNAITAGEVYTYIVTKSEAGEAEGVIKPVALIVNCKGNGCERAAEAPGAHFDGELLTVPIAAESGDALAKQSGFKFVHFIQVMRQFPVPGPREVKGSNLGDIGSEPMMVLTNTTECELDGLAKFLPVGAAEQVSLPCTTRFERTPTRDRRVPGQTVEDKIRFEISYAGSGWATLPSGNWEVKKLAFKTIPEDASHIATEGESLFSPQLGINIRTHTVGHNPANKSTTESTSELISVAP